MILSLKNNEVIRNSKNYVLVRIANGYNYSVSSCCTFTEEVVFDSSLAYVFAKDFLLDMSDAGAQVHFNAMRKIAAEHPSEVVGKDIRKLYSWADEEKFINN